jgi:hypothetical protein
LSLGCGNCSSEARLLHCLERWRQRPVASPAHPPPGPALPPLVAVAQRPRGYHTLQVNMEEMLDGFSGDLEDKLLRQNLLYEKEEDERGPRARVEVHDSDHSDEEEKEEAREQTGRGMRGAYSGRRPREGDDQEELPPWVAAVDPTPRPGRAQTGPKGVIADHDEAMMYKQMMRDMEKQACIDMVRDMTIGVYSDTPSVSLNAQRAAAAAAGVKPGAGAPDADAEEDFVAKYRAERLAQLKRTHTRRTFGALTRVTPFQFVDEVDQEDPRVVVVVHLHDDSVPACRDVSQCLGHIAAHRRSVKFLSLAAHDARHLTGDSKDNDFPAPTLMIYK